jgi:hypothetical protein
MTFLRERSAEKDRKVWLTQGMALSRDAAPAAPEVLRSGDEKRGSSSDEPLDSEIRGDYIAASADHGR